MQFEPPRSARRFRAEPSGKKKDRYDTGQKETIWKGTAEKKMKTPEETAFFRCVHPNVIVMSSREIFFSKNSGQGEDLQEAILHKATREKLRKLAESSK